MKKTRFFILSIVAALVFGLAIHLASQASVGLPGPVAWEPGLDGVRRFVEEALGLPPDGEA